MVVCKDESLIQGMAEQVVTANNIYKKLNLVHYSILKGLIVNCTIEMLLDFFIIHCITLDLDKWQSGSMACKCKAIC